MEQQSNAHPLMTVTYGCMESVQEEQVITWSAGNQILLDMKMKTAMMRYQTPSQLVKRTPSRAGKIKESRLFRKTSIDSKYSAKDTGHSS